MKVVKGIRKIGPVEEHWAISFDGVFYELSGAGKKSQGNANEIEIHTDASVYEEFEQLGYTSPSVGLTDISRFNVAWKHDHPFYGWNAHNCQQYVVDVANEFIPGLNLQTQNSTLGRFGMALGFIGVVLYPASLVGWALGAAGIIVKGNHA